MQSAQSERSRVLTPLAVGFSVSKKPVESIHIHARYGAGLPICPQLYHRSVQPCGKRLRRWIRATLVGAAVLTVGFYMCCILEMAAVRWTNPPTTALQVERRLEAWLHHRSYHKRQFIVPLSRISPELQHAVVAAEDGRFFQHHGIDWKEVDRLVDRDLEEGRLGRGGSTITQQLIKNLFLTGNRSLLRKAVEFTLAPVAERLLSKRRILELYLNEIEWGPGVYGAEAAARIWYGIPAARLNREQAARLAAVIPSPLRRKPERMDQYSAEILRRMGQSGW